MSTTIGVISRSSYTPGRFVVDGRHLPASTKSLGPDVVELNSGDRLAVLEGTTWIRGTVEYDHDQRSYYFTGRLKFSNAALLDELEGRPARFGDVS